jgi:hypothetical protein
MPMRLPLPRGPITDHLADALRRPPHLAADPLPPLPDLLTGPVTSTDSPAALHDEDLQLALFVCYELHYQGFDEVDDGWEWEPALLAFRAAAEARFLAALHAAVPPAPAVPAAEVPAALVALVAADDGPPLARYLQRSATLGQFREFVTHRSVYQLKEGDPHTWAIPRLRGRTKAALVEIQADEYGGGQAHRMHAELFRATLRGLGMDDSYGAYLDEVPAVTLAVNNLMSLFGLHRRHRGALLGHLAALEMTSSLPNRRYSEALRRLGGDQAATRFYDEHVEADAVHEQIAAHDLCGTFAVEHPDEAAQVLFGAAAALTVERLFAEHVLGCWQAGRSSLRTLAAVPEACA